MKALIVGGGIGGLTAALSLAQSGVQVEIFEQAVTFSEVGAGIQLSPNCSRVLHQLGLESALREIAFLPEATQFRHWRSGAVIASSALGERAVSRYGFPYYHVHRGDLLRVLLMAAGASAKIRLHTGSQVQSFSQDHQMAGLKVNDREVAGDLLIGADGIHSIIRRGLWGNQQPSFTGNVAWRALVPADRIPAAMVQPVSSVWWGPGKHFVHYYVRQGELVNCVCVVEKSGWEVESWTAPGEISELKTDFSGWHNTVTSLIDHMEPASLFKWALFDRPPMQSWRKGRVTLLGDACHPTLPFMAQGAAMAIEDAAVLTTCLRQGIQIADSLQRYEDLRRRRTAEVQRGSRRNATVFHMAGVKAWFRDRVAGFAGGRSMDALYRYDALDSFND